MIMWGFKEPWKLIMDTADLVSYELASKELRVRIEARKDDEENWIIFKTYHDDTAFTYSQEYRSPTKDEALSIILSLQKERLLSKKELHALKLSHAKRATLNLKRQFKDYNVEKWVFAVNDQNYENVVYLRDAEISEVSIIMHEKHKIMESNILQELRGILGLDAADLDIRQDLYYYTTKSESYVKSKKYGVLFGKMEMDFDMTNDENKP
jgi:hypothetical protein